MKRLLLLMLAMMVGWLPAVAQAWADAAKEAIPGRVMQLTPPARTGQTRRFHPVPPGGSPRKACFYRRS